MAYFGAISPNGGTCYGKLQFTATQYPQIHGNGILQLGGDSRNEYGVVCEATAQTKQMLFGLLLTPAQQAIYI